MRFLSTWPACFRFRNSWVLFAFGSSLGTGLGQKERHPDQRRKRSVQEIPGWFVNRGTLRAEPKQTRETSKAATNSSVKLTLNAYDGAWIPRTMSDLAKRLEREAYEQIRKAKQYPRGSTLRMLKENHAQELLREVKRLRVTTGRHRSSLPVRAAHPAKREDDVKDRRPL